jgi:hypothetical protein
MCDSKKNNTNDDDDSMYKSTKEKKMREELHDIPFLSNAALLSEKT